MYDLDTIVAMFREACGKCFTADDIKQLEQAGIALTAGLDDTTECGITYTIAYALQHSRDRHLAEC